jgi:hypothetical protein
MSPRRRLRSGARWLAAGAGFAAGAYTTYVGVTWLRYGRPRAARTAQERDDLLDRFMPAYEVVERHHIRIAAPAAITFAAAREMNLLDSAVVRALVKGRELILGATPDDRPRPRGLLAQTESLGWRVLADVPGCEVVVGAVTQPWQPNVTFRGLPPDEFAAFSEPGYIKIAWTLRADPIDAAESIFRTETRTVATDSESRRRFRRYWAFFSPGIIAIRWALLGPLKREAERRYAERQRDVDVRGRT